MNFREFLNLLKTKKQTIFSVVFLVLVITSAFTFTQPFRYGSVSKVLVVQSLPTNSDPFAISKSNELLSGLLADVITSDSFYDEVIKSGYKIDRSYFYEDGNARKELRNWEKAIDTNVMSNRGIIEIKIYHEDKGELKKIAEAVNYTLQTKHTNYHGGGNFVVVKVISKPIISDWPMKPNVIINYGVAVIFGLVFFLLYIYLFPEERYSLRLWPHTKHKTLQVGGQAQNTKQTTVRSDKNASEDNWSQVGEVLESGYKSYENEVGQTGYEIGEKEPEEFDKKGNMNNIFGQSNPGA